MKTFTTCKLIFEFGFTKEKVESLLKKYTEHGKVATFNCDITVGCNRMSFAVVDVPEEVVTKLSIDGIVKELDLMASFERPLLMAESCNSGGCCGGGCS